jgi:putative RecB family exonuclease
MTPSPVRSLSPSRAADFKQCPLLYRFRVIDRFPEPPSPAAARGTLVHSVLERLFDLPATQRTPSAAVELLPDAWEAMLAAEPALADLTAEQPDGDWLSSAEPLLHAYFELEDPRQLEPAERELAVEVVLDDGDEPLRLRGFVDRLDVSGEGLLRVVDYKTGKSPKPGFEAKAMFQMRFYALVLWRTRGVVPRMLQLVYLGSKELLRYEPDEADLRATERQIRALADAIERAEQTQDFRPNRTRLCDWCQHQSRCPEFGGTIPPFPSAVPEVGIDAEVPSASTPVDEL